MKNLIKFIFGYVLVVFFINFFYTEYYGNFFFLLLTFSGLIFNLLVIFKTDVLSKKYKFLSAGFIGVFTAFIVFNGGIVTLMYVKNLNYIEANRFIDFLNYNMLMKFTTAAALGNISLWLGYYSKIGDYLFSFYYIGLGYKNFLNLEINVNFPKTLIFFGLLFNAILFSYGGFGRGTATPEDYTGFVKYLLIYSSYIQKISVIGYFLLALIYFKTGLHKRWFWVSLSLLVFFALISGARGPIIFLFILTVLPYYYVKRKVTKGILLIGFVTVLIAFTIASEIKSFTQKVDTTQVSLADYKDEFIQFREASGEEFDKKIYSTLYYSIILRLNTVAPGSIAIKYKDNHGLDKSDPNFVKEFFMVPVYTFIPRSKVLNSVFPSWGNWFRIKVLGFSDSYFSNTTFGSVAFFYFLGDWLFVVIGFFFYGVSLKFGNNVLELGTGLSFLLYLTIISSLGYITASVPAAIVSFLRYIVFLPLFFYVVIGFFNRLRL